MTKMTDRTKQRFLPTTFFLGLILITGSPRLAVGQPAPPDDRTALQKAEELREDMREMMTLARDRVFPALVNIEVITIQYWGGKEQKGQSTGSGTIIDPKGYVLTNFHVVEDGKKFTCTLADKQEIPATLVGQDPLTDLAVLQLDLDKVKKEGRPLPAAIFGDSDAIEIGDTVMAMGSPWALSRSVTRGSVSNTERILSGSDDDPGEMRFDRDQTTGIFNRWIQHDAAINPGNSGGPLVNLKGEVIGVNTRGASNMGFAIPSNIAKNVAAALIEHGEVPRSFYGFNIKSIKRTGFDRGVLVTSVMDDGPAAKSGMQAGDLIISINGKPVTATYPEQIPPLLKDLADQTIGGTVQMTVQRDGEPVELDLVTAKRQRDRGDEAAFRAFGLALMGITETMAQNRLLDSTDGALVSSVRGSSPVQQAKPPIDGGDVIRAVDGKPVHSLTDFAAIYNEMAQGEEWPEYVLIEYNRRGQNYVTIIEPREDKDEDPPREVAKAWIGVATQPVVKELAEKLGYPKKTGFRVTRVYPRTMAAESDLKVGDIIVALNDTLLEPKGNQDSGLFEREVKKLDIGDNAVLTVLRDKKELEIKLELERTRLTSQEARSDRNRDFEISVRELTFFDRDENRWDEDVRGVIVKSVEPAGWAGLGGLNPGDLIQRIGDKEVKGIQTYRKIMEAIAKEQPERVVFVVLRGARTQFLYVEPDWKPVIGDEEKQSQKENSDA